MFCVTTYSLHFLVSASLVRTMQDDKGNTSAAYREFLTVWKDADPDIPILKQAKAEYAKLQ